jgi:anti-sigma B factor antagonist
MPDKITPTLAPVIVTLPGEIDVTNAADAEAQITAALTPGIMVIIADLTATRFCDSTGLQHLMRAGEKAAASGTQLRLAVAPDGTVARVMQITGITRHIAVYPTLEQAARGGPPPPD